MVALPACSSKKAKRKAAGNGSENTQPGERPKKKVKRKSTDTAAVAAAAVVRAAEQATGKTKKKANAAALAETAPLQTEDEVKAKKKKKQPPQNGGESGLLEGLRAILEAPDATAALAEEEAAVERERKAAEGRKKKAAKDAVAAAAAERRREERKQKLAKRGGAATAMENVAGDDVPEGPLGKKRRKEGKIGEVAEETEQPLPDHLHPYKVFVNGIPWSTERRAVQKEFSECGEIERLDMPRNSQGLSSGTAFIYFKDDAAVQKALEKNGKGFCGRIIKVLRAKRQTSTGEAAASAEARTAVVAGLPPTTQEDILRDAFSDCGEIQAIRMSKTKEGKFKGAAFIVFKSVEAVAEAVERDGDEYDGSTIEVRRLRQDSSAGKGPGKGKGGAKGKGKIIKDSRRRTCHAFTEGKCIWGPNCRYVHA